MEYIALTLTIITALVVRNLYKRVHYLERDVTSMQGEKITVPEEILKAEATPTIVEEHATREAMRIAEEVDERLDPKLRKAGQLAKKYAWDFLDHQENIKLLRLTQQRGASNIKINIYYGRRTGASTYTVATALKHPKKGKTQLFRKHVTLQELEQILENPRAHSGKGYYKK